MDHPPRRIGVNEVEFSDDKGGTYVFLSLRGGETQAKQSILSGLLKFHKLRLGGCQTEIGWRPKVPEEMERAVNSFERPASEFRHLR